MTAAAYKLTRKISIESPVAGQGADGSPVIGWTPFATGIWAQIADLSGRELIAAQGVQSPVQTSILIRYRKGVLPKMRVLHGAEVYDIEAVLDKEGFGRWLTLLCSKGLNRG